ncbi:MAG: BON domain-containing protein [Bryobacteraceae bacterium]
MRAILCVATLSSLPLTLKAEVAAPPAVQSDQSVMRMAEQVERAVRRLPQYSLFDDIRFTISNYVVTLKGSTSRPVLKSAAERAVSEIEGVTGVVNQIEVLPLNQLDEDIRFRVYSAIYGHAWLQRYDPNRGGPVFFARGAIMQGVSQDPPVGYHPIHIIVRNGKVKLTGVVATAADKALAGVVTNALPNIFEVENDLAIAEEAKPGKPVKGKATSPKASSR